ncbi:flagellar assembly factor FliW [Lebetimonas natsushimae]|uniref:Flagellar assembly factor FliW n=1 Tax=Lebetimonas natsushimae TaxID=1936991 RepID=A0A292YAX6_9BACT|nr:flagellar assembly protein FliW [Lebetimonas natsushimae]GAX88112.1 flagellar assembly factor FliW [Lebetimonas natsushimae]
MKYKVVLPILGFENIEEFDLEEIEPNFYKLKSGDVSFTLINPAIVRNDYVFEIDEESQKKLKLNEKSNYFVLNIMIINKPFIESTVNFAAPLIFNNDKKIMGQVVLDKYPYSLTDPLSNYVKGK